MSGVDSKQKDYKQDTIKTSAGNRCGIVTGLSQTGLLQRASGSCGK
jgi:hypothetical protein